MGEFFFIGNKDGKQKHFSVFQKDFLVLVLLRGGKEGRFHAIFYRAVDFETKLDCCEHLKISGIVIIKKIYVLSPPSYVFCFFCLNKSVHFLNLKASDE